MPKKKKSVLLHKYAFFLFLPYFSRSAVLSHFFSLHWKQISMSFSNPTATPESEILTPMKVVASSALKEQANSTGPFITQQCPLVCL